jgi:hypothetical protein
VEAYINQKNGDTKNLAPYISTQQCMDCARNNNGCDGEILSGVWYKVGNSIKKDFSTIRTTPTK